MQLPGSKTQRNVQKTEEKLNTAKAKGIENAKILKLEAANVKARQQHQKALDKAEKANAKLK